MFDMYAVIWYITFHEQTRCAVSFATCTGGPPPARGRCGEGRHVPGRGSADFWRIAPIGEQLDEDVPFRGTSMLEIGATRAASGPAARAASGGHGRAVDHRPVPGPAQVAVRALDAGGVV